MKTEIEELVRELFSLMDVAAEINVTPEADGFLVELTSSQDTGLLIGRRGETLNALQSFLAIALRQKTGEWVRVTVNVGNWREKQRDYLQDLAAQTAERVLATGEAEPLYNLTAEERREVHLALAEHEKVTTESTGEGKERYLIVKPK